MVDPKKSLTQTTQMSLPQRARAVHRLFSCRRRPWFITLGLCETLVARREKQHGPIAKKEVMPQGDSITQSRLFEGVVPS